MLLLFAGIVCTSDVMAQQKSVSELEAAILLNAIKYIDWPASQNDNTFVMGVSGDDELYSVLEQTVKSKQKNGKKIAVSKLDAQKIDATSCDLFFLGNDAIASFEKNKDLLKAKPILLVTNKESYARKGAGMNFIIVNGKMVIEINEPVMKESGFRVSGALLTMSTIIK